MKKLIIICLLALTYTSTYAQEPTKQETMDWIASKFRDNINKSFSYSYFKIQGVGLNNTYKFNFYSSGIISWTMVTATKTSSSESPQINSTNYKIDLNGLSNIETTPYHLDLFFKNGYSTYSYNNDNFKESSLIQIFEKSNSDVRVSDESVIDWKSEPDLYNRFTKALQLLLKYNVPKQKF